MKLNFVIHVYSGEIINFEYECNLDILVKDFLILIHNKFFRSNFVANENSYLIPYYSFINDGVEQKARPEFNLINFLNNFHYNLNCINISYIYGIGGGFEFEDFAIIRVNANEPHMAPHVHIYSGKQTESCVRIVLNTMTQMKNDSIPFEKLFTNKERKILIDFLTANKEKIVDYYSRCIKGEYITQEYVLTYNGKEYSLYSRYRF